MYLAHDAYAPDLDQQVEQAIRKTLTLHPTTKTYALIDAALLPEWGAKLWGVSQSEPNGSLQALYQDTPLQELEECAPFIGLIGPSDLKGQFEHCSGTPFLSLICSKLDISSLRKHLAQFSRVETPDGIFHTTRVADTAVLPLLLRGMTAKQLATFAQGLDAWYIVGRDGLLQALSMPEKAQKAPVHGDEVRASSFTMSEQAMATVVDATDADRMLCALGEKYPSLVEQRPSAQWYQMASTIVHKMNNLKIEAEPERISAFRQAMASPSEEAALAVLQALAPST